jgi:Ni/Fe-hydrogenase subunit HybB-like protein
MEHLDPKPTGGKIFTPPILGMLLVFAVCAYFLILRYANGIGHVSSLTDHVPWGIWKVIGVIVGAALVCGGYTCAFTVYVFNGWKYHRFIRPAILLSLLGYSFAGASLAYDVGRYWGLFNFFIPKYWQGNSVLFEVAICITAYILILVIEVAPSILEKFYATDKADNLAAKLHAFLNKVLFLVLGLGVVLPTMHQSGLGGLALIMGEKISPLWQTPFVSLLHLISCIAMGYGCVIATEVLFADNYKDKVQMSLLGQFANLMKIFVIVFLALRWIEIIRAGGVSLAFDFGSGYLDAYSFWVEMLLHIGGLYLIWSKSVQASPKNIFFGGWLIMLGGSLYRINVYIIGFHPEAGVSYFPSLSELIISIGMVCLQIAIFITLVKIFPIITKK